MYAISIDKLKEMLYNMHIIIEGMAMITLYIDIDGTLISISESRCYYYPVAKNCLEFLQFVTQNFRCKFLSFHTRSGEMQEVYDVFKLATNSDELSLEWKAVLNKIEPVKWKTRKTQGVNFADDFIWIDDEIDILDKAVLAKHGTLESVVNVFVNDMPYDLFRVQLILQNILENANETS